MILLFALFQGLQNISDAELLTLVGKSLEIFDAMDRVTVARNSSRLVKELLDIARVIVVERQQLATFVAKEQSSLGLGVRKSNVNGVLRLDPSNITVTARMGPTPNHPGGSRNDADILNTMTALPQEDLFAVLSEQNLFDTMDIALQSGTTMAEYSGMNSHLWLANSSLPEDDWRSQDDWRISYPVNDGVLLPHGSYAPSEAPQRPH